MATYYKYAERSADSQINWAEVGKNMSDMLLEENRIREDKKASIDAASRQYGEVLANSPMGEHKTAREATLKFADDAANYMRIQDQLLKSGQLKLKDYTIARQNLLDGTNNAFTAMKEFQNDYGELMERAKTNKSALLELRSMEQVQKFGNWSKSGFYINPTDGNVNVAMMTEKDINGKKVYTMDSNPGEFASVNFVRGLIKTRFNRYDPNVAADGFVNSLGKQIEAVQKSVGDLKRQGLIETVNDIRTKKEIDPVTKQILFSIDMAEDQAVKAALANDYDRASLLTDSKKTASNGKLYDFTDDAKEAAKPGNENLILKTYDPNTGQIALKFTNNQIKDSDEYMKTEFRRRYDYEKDIKTTPQTQLQESRPPTGAEIDERNRRADAKIFGENLAMALTGKDPVAIGNSIKYLANKSGKIVNRTSTGITISNTDGTGSTTYSFTEAGKVADPKKLTKAMISSFGTALPEETIVNVANNLIGSNQLERATSASGFNPTPQRINPVEAYNQQVDVSISKSPAAKWASEDAFAKELNNSLTKFGYTAKPSLVTEGVYLRDKDGNDSDVFEITGDEAKNKQVLKRISDFIKTNLKGATPEEKEANAQGALQTLGVTRAGGVGAKYN